jgi:adenylate cyclase
MRPERPTILVVDDTPTNVRLLEALLAPDHDVSGCLSGEEALASARAHPPDLVLLDVHMPGMNGYEVCRRLREHPATAMVPVVMVTASGDEEKVRVIEAGADDFLLRPFDQDVLLARIRSLLRVKRYQDTIELQSLELRTLADELERRVADQVRELDQLRALRRFLPPLLAQAFHDGASKEVLEPHRGEVAVVVLDLDGYSELLPSTTPEDALQILADHQAAIGALVTRHGATVGWLNDAMTMLFFNDPVPCDDPVESAVALVLDAREVIAELTEDWARSGYDLRLRAGVSFGHATLGTVGFEGRYDYTAVGRVVAEARGLCAAAPPDEVLLSPRAHREVASVVRATEHPEPAADTAVRPWRLEGWADGDRRARGAVEVQILGPVRITADGTSLDLRARERQLLALLAVQHDAVVTADRLVDEIWEGAPAESAVAALRVHVSRLRKALSTVDLDHLLETQPTGYLLRLKGRASLDADRFEEACAAGRSRLADEPVAAVGSLRGALALWRGPALVDVSEMPSILAARRRLEELRLVALEDCLEAELALGHHREVLVELQALTHEHPLRERLWAHRMRALFRSGRQPEALRAFQDHRTMLADDVGLEPSAALVELERQIVAGDSSV